MFSLTYAGHFGGFTYPRCCESFTNLPGKYGRIVPLALDDGGDDTRGEQPGPAPSDGLWLQEASAPVPAQDLTDAAVGHLKYARTYKATFLLS